MARIVNEVRDAILAKMTPITKKKASKKETTKEKVESVVSGIKKIIKK